MALCPWPCWQMSFTYQPVNFSRAGEPNDWQKAGVLSSKGLKSWNTALFVTLNNKRHTYVYIFYVMSISFCKWAFKATLCRFSTFCDSCVCILVQWSPWRLFIVGAKFIFYTSSSCFKSKGEDCSDVQHLPRHFFHAVHTSKSLTQWLTLYYHYQLVELQCIVSDLRFIFEKYSATRTWMAAVSLKQLWRISMLQRSPR